MLSDFTTIHTNIGETRLQHLAKITLTHVNIARIRFIVAECDVALGQKYGFSKVTIAARERVFLTGISESVDLAMGRWMKKHSPIHSKVNSPMQFTTS
jgi:hypothetical protein